MPSSMIGESKGILHSRAGEETFHLALQPATPALTPFVERYWIVTWDLRGQQPYEQRTLPAPSVQMAFGPDFSRIVGVTRGVFSCLLEDVGRILGVRFRPGCFHPFLRAPLSSITDRVLAVDEVFGDGGRALARAVRDADEAGEPDGTLTGLVDRFLCAVAPEQEPAAEEAARLVELIAADPRITRVDALARRSGMSLRTLQRLYAEYVGVGPKWVIRRYRIYEAAQRVASGGEADLARVALDLGYFDQAHFTHDFTAVVGSPPDRYARDCALVRQSSYPDRRVRNRSALRSR